jgi:hypothetical protein
VRQFYYGGYVAFHEAERISAADLAKALSWARESLLEPFDPRSQSHWAELIRNESAGPIDVRRTHAGKYGGALSSAAKMWGHL